MEKIGNKQGFIKTERNFVVGCGKDEKGFCWFVGHPKLNKGQAVPVKVGELEERLREMIEQLKRE